MKTMTMVVLAALLGAAAMAYDPTDPAGVRRLGWMNQRGDGATISRPGVRGGDLTKPPPAGVKEIMRIGKKTFDDVKFGPLRDGRVFVSFSGGSEWLPGTNLPKQVQVRLGLRR